MKKVLSFFILMLLPMVARAEPVYINGIYYELVSKIKEAEVKSNPNEKYSGSVVIPPSVTYKGMEYSVTSIGGSAFRGCSGLTSITIGDSVTSIGEYAFLSCSGLTSVTIGNSVTSMGERAFGDCRGLTSVHISDLEAWCKISFNDYDSNPLYYAHHLYLDGKEITNLVIPNSVTSIGGSAFSGCSGLTSLTIGDSVTSIGQYAFSGCSGLTSVTIPNSVTNIEFKAFTSCSSLTSVTIGNSVTSIGWYAFYCCSSLTSVTIGNEVETIYCQAFAYCKELTDVYCLAEKVPKMYDFDGNIGGTDAFIGSDIEHATLHVPFASIDAYKAVEPWKSFKSIVGLNGEEIPVTPKCDKPNIIKEGNRLRYECGTPGATFRSTLTPKVETQQLEGSEVTIERPAISYTLTVIASAEGYEDSDPVTMTFTSNSEVCDVNQDGAVDVADIATIISKMASGARMQEETEESK